MYLEDWTGVQARIFYAWKSQTAAGRVRALLEALEGKRTIKETTSVLAGCGKTMSARETGGPSETGQTRWDPICPRRAFPARHASRSMDAGGLF